jgi:hypothetical protein
VGDTETRVWAIGPQLLKKALRRVVQTCLPIAIEWRHWGQTAEQAEADYKDCATRLGPARKLSNRSDRVTSSGSAVNHLLKSVVREIRTLRSVGTGGRATASGDPVGGRQGRPYRDPRQPSESGIWAFNRQFNQKAPQDQMGTSRVLAP